MFIVKLNKTRPLYVKSVFFFQQVLCMVRYEMFPFLSHREQLTLVSGNL